MIEGRPQAPFGRRDVPVVSTSSLGPYRLIEVEDQAASQVRAGQFHMLSTASGWESDEEGRPWLARAISFLSTDNSGRIVFLIDPIGPGTRALAEAIEDDVIQVVGPLGNGFPDPQSDCRPLLVGGGIGLAPILAFSDQLERAGIDHDLIVGFRTGEHAESVAHRDKAIVTTDDGSVGHAGSVFGPTSDLIASGKRELFACGPPAMMEALRALADRHSVDSWFALESPMACGFGACFGCAVETRDGILRLCVDGPVLPGSSLEKITATGRAD